MELAKAGKNLKLAQHTQQFPSLTTRKGRLRNIIFNDLVPDPKKGIHLCDAQPIWRAFFAGIKIRVDEPDAHEQSASLER